MAKTELMTTAQPSAPSTRSVVDEERALGLIRDWLDRPEHSRLDAWPEVARALALDPQAPPPIWLQVAVIGQRISDDALAALPPDHLERLDEYLAAAAEVEP